MKLNFKEKSILKFKDKFEYGDLTTARDKDVVTLKCKIHSVTFDIVAGYHLNNKTGSCPECIREYKNEMSTKYSMTTEQFIEKAKQVHGDKYDYSKFVYTLSRGKSTVICNIHGDFEVSANNHLRGKKCPECAKIISGQKRTLKAAKTFVGDAKKIHKNKYSYSNFQYIKAKIRSNITCKTHGDFLCSPDNHLRGKGCPKCAKAKVKFVTLNKFKAACDKNYKQGILYILKFNHINSNHDFIKIGITSKTVKHRYNFEHYSEYTYNILKEYSFNPETTYKLEQKIHKLFYDYRDYSVSKNFNGYSECYTLQLPLEEVFKNIEMEQ